MLQLYRNENLKSYTTTLHIHSLSGFTEYSNFN